MNHKIVNEEYEGKTRAFVYSGNTKDKNQTLWYLALGVNRVCYYLDKFEMVWKACLINSSDTVIGKTEKTATRDGIIEWAKKMLVHPEQFAKFQDTWYTRLHEGYDNDSFYANRKAGKYRRKR